MKKYEFTGETKIVNETTLHRIKAVSDFGDVKAGDIGGWIEKEENLSHGGTAWVYGDAEVSDNAKVYGNAEVSGNAKVFGNAEVWGDAEVYGNAEVGGNAKVYGDAEVSDNAEVWGDAEVSGNAKVFGNAEVWGDAEVSDNAKVFGNAEVGGNAKVFGNAEAWGDAEVRGNAKIFSTDHVLVIGAIGSRDDFTTFFRDKDNEITVKCGCFLGKVDEFLEKVTQTHKNTKYALVYRAAVGVAKLQIDLNPEQTDHETNVTGVFGEPEE